MPILARFLRGIYKNVLIGFVSKRGIYLINDSLR